MIAACGSFGATDSAPDASSEVSTLADAPVADGSSGDGGTCQSGAFCDSFDDGLALPRAWFGPTIVGNANLRLGASAGVNGSGGLVATVVADTKSQSARLQHNLPMPAPAAYDVVIAFSALVNLTTDGVVLGPRFVANGATAGNRNLSVTFKKGIVRLDPNACDAGDCALPANEVKVNPGWHRYTLTLVVRPAGSTYELAIDGLSAINKPLPLLLSSPTSYGLWLGVTYTDGTAAGTISLDDASFLLTPH